MGKSIYPLLRDRLCEMDFAVFPHRLILTVTFPSLLLSICPLARHSSLNLLSLLHSDSDTNGLTGLSKETT